MEPIRTVHIVGMGALGLLFGNPTARHLPGQPRYVMDAERMRRRGGETCAINGRASSSITAESAASRRR